MGTPFRLACLDMAGTTVTDDGAVRDAFAVAIATAGIEAPSARFDRAAAYVHETMGQSKIDVFTALLDGDRPAAERANAAFEAAYAASIGAGRVSPMPGADAAMDELAAGGIKICLTTGFAPATRDALLAALGWQGRADLVLAPADSGRGRPYPDMILSAVLALRIDDVRSVVVVGDTTNDLLAGRRAGAGLVVGVLTGAHDKDQLSSVAGSTVIDSIAELPALLFEASDRREASRPRPTGP
jgi:phosphoglycolate phosphatase